MTIHNSNFSRWLEYLYYNWSAGAVPEWEDDNVTSVVPEPPSFLLSIWMSLYVIIFVVGLFGNVAVTFVVLRCRSMRTFINFLFLNLCIADLLLLFISGPTAVADMFAREVWYLGKFMCKFIPFLENVVGNASVMTILAISVERYRVSGSSTIGQHPTTRLTIIRTSVLIWLISVVAATPIIFITSLNNHLYVDGTSVPVCKTPITSAWHKTYVVLTTAFFFVLPLLAICFLYAKVCCRLVSLFKTEQEKLQSYPREIVKLKRQMIQIIVTVVLVFFICHTPYRALTMMTMFIDQTTLYAIHFEAYLTLFYMTRILFYSNHSINPFVYNFVSRKFRRALLWLCCERRRRVTRLEDWRDYANHRYSLRHESLRIMRVLDGRIELEVNTREKEDLECTRSCHRYQRNDFLVLYENLMLLE